MVSIDTIYSQNTPLVFKHTVAKEETGLEEDLTGTLYLSKDGYVYNGQSKPVLWIKFLGLALSIPLRTVIVKVCRTVQNIFGENVGDKGSHDMGHMLHLSGIAWKGVIGWKKTLRERAAEFSLTELGYNAKDITKEMQNRRSDRLLGGFYTAPCMHPLFHKEQTEPKLVFKLKVLNEKIKLIEKEQQSRQESFFTKLFKGPQKPQPNVWEQKIKTFSDQKLAERRKYIDGQLKNLKGKMGARSIRYANSAVISQHPFMQVKPDLTKLIYEEKKVDVCGTTWYSQKKYCGCIYKIDCCESLTCWAIDCICCACCFMPATGDCAVLC